MTARHSLDQIVRGLDGVTAGPERIWITNETDWVSFSRNGASSRRYGASSLEHEDCPEYVRADLFRELEERLEKAAEALEPFAKVEPMDVYEDEDEDARGSYILTQSDFRRARKALATIRRTTP